MSYQGSVASFLLFNIVMKETTKERGPWELLLFADNQGWQQKYEEGILEIRWKQEHHKQNKVYGDWKGSKGRSTINKVAMWLLWEISRGELIGGYPVQQMVSQEILRFTKYTWSKKFLCLKCITRWNGEEMGGMTTLFWRLAGLERDRPFLLLLGCPLDCGVAVEREWESGKE